MAVAVQPEAQERVRITRAHNEGRDYISVRKWYRAADGAWYPTKLGVNLRADLFTRDSLAELKRAMAGGDGS